MKKKGLRWTFKEFKGLARRQELKIRSIIWLH